MPKNSTLGIKIFAKNVAWKLCLRQTQITLGLLRLLTWVTIPNFFSEAEKMELINAAVGSAEAVVAAGRARAQSIELVAKALCDVNGQVSQV